MEKETREQQLKWAKHFDFYSETIKRDSKGNIITYTYTR